MKTTAMEIGFFVYVLVSHKSGLRFYVGMCSDVENRLKEHNVGKTKSTKGYIPWQLFYFEKFNTRKEAREREKYLKSGSGKEKIREKWSRNSTECLPATTQAKPSTRAGREQQPSKL
jgi:putative endonuclease